MRTKPRPASATAWLGTAVTALALAACGGGDEPLQTTLSSHDGKTGDQTSTSATSATSTTSTTTAAQPPTIEGRLLASNCFQCHGTLGVGGFDKIRGGEAKEVFEYATKPAASNIMAAHAQGYTPEQLRKIVAYLQQ